MTTEQTLEAISKYGISTVFATILLVVFLKYAFDTLKIILRKLDIITELITKRELLDFQAVGIFKAVMNEEIHTKLMVAKQKLIDNDIKNRRKQIEQSLSTQFYKITQEKVQFLSTFITPAGNIGSILAELLEIEQWKAYMTNIFTVFFGEGEIQNKLEDISAIMNEMENNFVVKIENNLYHK